jgi:hypothetical protein
MNIFDIPNVNKYALKYVFEDLQIKNENSLWLEFGVYSGSTINYISQFTSNNIYGFDSFDGLPEDWIDDNNNIVLKKGFFSNNGNIPQVNNNVMLIKGLFQDTLDDFINSNNNKKITFVHIDCDLYSSTKFVLEKIHPYLSDNCVFVFDELVNINNDSNELRALNEYIQKYNISYKWIGMLGFAKMEYPQHDNQSVAIYINYKNT